MKPNRVSQSRLPIARLRSLQASRGRRVPRSAFVLGLLLAHAVGAGALFGQTNRLDPSFSVGAGVSGQVGSYGQYVHDLEVDPEGRIVLGGNFTRVQGVSRSCIARLEPDGALDTTFEPGSGANQEVLAVCPQPDGKVLLGGAFTRVNGTIRSRLARLNPDGSLDESFQIGSGANDLVRDIALQPDGRILIVGQFLRFNGSNRSGVARLETDGRVDSTFDPGSGVGGTRFLDAVWVLDDGRILISGDFNTYDGTPRASIARLHPDGSLDPAFDPGSGTKPDDPIMSLAVQPDGKIVIAGSFTSFNRKPWKSVGRLLRDGQPDPDFNPGTGLAGGSGGFTLAHSVALDAAGNILLGGWFDRADSCTQPYLAKLLPSGRPDTNWNVRVDAQVRTVVLQPDGRVLLGGNFSRVEGAMLRGVARLQPGGAADGWFRSCRRTGPETLVLEFQGGTTNEYRIETSTDLREWEPWIVVAGGETVQLTRHGIDAQDRCFYRAWRQP